MTERPKHSLMQLCAVERVVEGWRASGFPENISVKFLFDVEFFFVISDPNVRPGNEVKDGHSQVMGSVVAGGS